MFKIFLSLLLGIVYSQILMAQTGNIIIPSGHAQSVTKIQVDKQGKFMYSLESGKVIMWNMKTHDQLYSFPNEFGKTLSLSNDGTKLLIGQYCYSTISGKFLFQVKGYSPVFSLDDKRIYSFESNKVSMTDVASPQLSFISEYIPFGMSENFMVDNDHFLITGSDGWILYNVTARKLEAQSKNVVFYHPGLKAVASREKRDSIIIRDLFSGNKLAAIKSNNPVFRFYPAAKGKNFIIDQNTDLTHSDWTIYDGETMSVIRKFNHYSSGDIPLFFLNEADNVYLPGRMGIAIVDTKKNSEVNSFTRQVAKIEQETYSQLEYNYNGNLLNLITDDSIYKSVNTVQMKPVRHQVLPQFNTIAFSPSGDTVAMFDYDKTGKIKNLVSSKQLIPTLHFTDEPSTTEAKNFFFNKNGTYAYYTVQNVAKQICNLNRVNVTTGKIEKMVTFKHTRWPILHPDKDLLAAFDEGYQYTHAKVWDITNGKILFDKDMKDADCKYINVSRDKKEVIIITTKTFEKYSFSGASLLSTTQNPIFTNYDNYACTPDLNTVFASDVYGNLAAHKIDGKKLYEVKLHDGAITNKFFSPEGGLIYTVSGDQSIKISYSSTGELLGTLYLFNDGNDYVFITAQGRFDGSEGGMKRMYYFQDRIQLPLTSVYEKYFTPNLYQRLLAGEKFEPIPNIQFKPKPKTKILYAEKQRNLEVEDDVANYANATGIAEITVSATAPEDKVDEIRLFHNGKVVNLATRGLFVTDNDGSDSKKYTVNLLPGNNSFRAIALNSQRTESDGDEINVSYSASGNQPTPKPVTNNNTATISAIDKNATMYLMVVGINAYTNKINPLTYALPDATSFKDEIEKDAKSVLANVKTYFITDAKADKAGIVNAFNEIKKDAKPQDVFVFYYAGHGYISPTNKEFYLVSADVADGGESLLKNGIAAKELQQYAVDIQAQKQLFILDACQSAGAFDAMLKHDGEQQKSLAVVARSTGSHWMAASGSTEMAKEFGELGHGAFTYVLLQALKGQAALNKMITVNGMKNFLQVQVPELVKKYGSNNQYPASYGFGNDFPVEILK